MGQKVRIRLNDCLLKTYSLYIVTALTFTVVATPVMATESGTSCANETDDLKRLACYDNIYRGLSEASEAPEKKPSQENHAASITIDPDEGTSVLSQAWELSQKEKRGTFTVRTYSPNFLLPMHYTSSVNQLPHSPTHPAETDPKKYRQIDAKLQISLRAKIAENFLLPNADLWFAYTQRSLWQVWDRADSSPFRSTDYQPEAIYIVPLSKDVGMLPNGWTARMLQLGIAHQSNGQSDPLSRSWNRLYAGVGLERGDLTVFAKANHRLSEEGKDDNPDLTDYIGRGEVTILWSPGTSTYSLTWHTNLDSRGSLQFDWTHPVISSQPMGLRWYAQLFSGYGETLLDYNHRQTSLGLGMALFQF
jgi:phospholipase A1